jgi:hypothetical protein
MEDDEMEQTDIELLDGVANTTAATSWQPATPITDDEHVDN